MTLDQRLAVAQDRTKVISGYQNAIDSGTLSEEEQQRAKLSISAVRIGLPPDSTAQTISETTDLYSHQAWAVTLGLPRDASEQAIKEAQERSDGDVAKNMCVDK
jgi:hypothetical protein